MVKQIAVYLNNFGQTAELTEAGIIKLYSKEQGKWNLVRELPFKVDSAKGMKQMRSEITRIAELLGECKVFVAKGVSGLTYTVLDTMGFNVWEMEGETSEFLEYVLEKEEEEEMLSQAPAVCETDVIVPVETEEEGCYYLNLKELQERKTSITSKQALQPFLNNGIFRELKVVCSHIPGWLERELNKLNLKFQISKSNPGEYSVVISH